MQGSLLLLLAFIGMFAIANLAVGFTFSTLAKNQLHAMQMTFFFFLPSLLLSGFMFPFRGMPGWAQVLGEAVPLTHFSARRACNFSQRQRSRGGVARALADAGLRRRGRRGGAEALSPNPRLKGARGAESVAVVHARARRARSYCAFAFHHRLQFQMSPQALLKRFYTAFSTLDARTMQTCYAPHAQFEDPLFTLQGAEQIGAMWQMVCQTIRNGGRAVWRLETHEVEAAGGERGSARWEARYRSGAAGRMVHNMVEAQFTFEDGLIVTHSESYDFWRWSRQALGSTGLVMGWTPMLRNQVRRQALGKLERFLAHRAAAAAAQ